jgi:hypothetical protein
MNSAQKVIEKFGGQTALARLLGKRQSMVQHWAKTGIIPAKWHRHLLKIAIVEGVDLQPIEFIDTASTEIAKHDGVISSEVAVLEVMPAEPPPENLPEEPDKSNLPVARLPGTIRLGGKELDCYVLDNGDRVISLSGAVRALTGTDSGNLGNYTNVDGLKPFLNQDIVAGGIKPFRIPGNPNPGRGLTAETFLDICNAYVAAFEAKTLKTDRQKGTAISCAVLLSSCAKVGLIALIDEATGHQYERAEDALQVKLRAFIAEELRAWEKTFPDELWGEFGRLTRWRGALHNRPKWWGKLVIELIYDTLDPDVAEYLKTHKPPPDVRWHQQLTDNYGVRQLVSRCYEIVGMAKDCRDIKELRQKVALHYGNKPVQFLLYLPDPKKQSA